MLRSICATSSRAGQRFGFDLLFYIDGMGLNLWLVWLHIMGPSCLILCIQFRKRKTITSEINLSSSSKFSHIYLHSRIHCHFTNNFCFFCVGAVFVPRDWDSSLTSSLLLKSLKSSYVKNGWIDYWSCTEKGSSWTRIHTVCSRSDSCFRKSHFKKLKVSVLNLNSMYEE